MELLKFLLKKPKILSLLLLGMESIEPMIFLLNWKIKNLKSEDYNLVITRDDVDELKFFVFRFGVYILFVKTSDTVKNLKIIKN